MNVLILTNKSYVDWANDFCIDYMSEHLIFIIYNKHDFDMFRKNYSYDVGISFMYTDKVPKEELENHTWFNFHPAPLPAYKGRNLCYHAIMNGETEFGATLHYMDENFDTGDIIEVCTFPILETDTAEDVSENAIGASKALFEEYFPRILAGEEFPRIKNEGGTYYKKESIVDEYDVSSMPVGDWIRAVTYKQFYPKVNIHGVTYKVVRE